MAIARRLATAWKSRDWPGYSAQKNYAARSHRTTGSCRSMPTSASPRSSRRKSRRRFSGEPAQSRLSHSARDLVSRTLDSHRPTGIPTISCGCTIGARRAGTGGACTSRSSSTARRAVLRHELQHYAYRDISHHLATIDRYTTLAAEQWLSEGRRTERARDVLPSAVRIPSQLRAARRIPRRRRRPARLEDECVLRVPEARQTVGAAAQSAFAASAISSRQSAISAVATTADVLAAHRHGAHVARRTEPGADDGDGPARARPSDDARRALRAASCGSARRRGSIWCRSRRRPRWT